MYLRLYVLNIIYALMNVCVREFVMHVCKSLFGVYTFARVPCVSHVRIHTLHTCVHPHLPFSLHHRTRGIQENTYSKDFNPFFTHSKWDDYPDTCVPLSWLYNTHHSLFHRTIPALVSKQGVVFPQTSINPGTDRAILPVKKQTPF